MKTILTTALGAALVLLAWGGAPQAQELAPEEFVAEAIQGNLAEIAFGRLASERGSSAAVRAFGAMLLEDHAGANGWAMGIAQKLEMTPPESPKDEEQAALERIGALSGEEFDRAFLEHMEQAHMAAIEMYLPQTMSADADIAAYAAETLPHLQQHLDTAQKLPGNE